IVPPAVIRPGVRRNTLPMPVAVPPAPVAGYEVEEKEEEEIRPEESGIQAILQNKELFFEFMDEVRGHVYQIVMA
ncbi:2194_t:CDS:1, partial [Acaulospora colombiana]